MYQLQLLKVMNGVSDLKNLEKEPILGICATVTQKKRTKLRAFIILNYMNKFIDRTDAGNQLAVALKDIVTLIHLL